jgi:hypothetical protein
MSTTTTITKPAPILEGSLTAFLKSVDKLGAGAVPSTFTGIDTSKFAPQVADQVALQTDAAKAAADLGTLVGPDAFKQFMSPYQQEVIDTTLAEFDRQQAIADTALRDRAIQAGAFGGGREGVMAAEAARGAATNRANLQAQLLAQGFQQAQQAAAADLAARQGLGQYQSALGQQQQAVEQAKLDAAQIAAKEAEFAPFTQIGLIGQQLAQIQPGAFPTQTVGIGAAAPTASIGGIAGKLGLFG